MDLQDLLFVFDDDDNGDEKRVVERQLLAMSKVNWCMVGQRVQGTQREVARRRFFSTRHISRRSVWACFRWRAHGGFGNQGNGRGRANRDRECIWFSPHCVKPHSAEQLDLWSV